MRTLILSVSILGLAASVQAQEYSPVNDPAQPYTFIGGSVLPPAGTGWRFKRHREELQLEFASGEDYRHTWAAVVSSYNGIDTTLSLDLLEHLARHRALEGQGRTMTPKSFEAMPDSTIAPLAVRYHYQIEDRNVPYDKGKLYNLEGRGVLMVHPDTPNLVIAIEYSERAEASIAMAQSAAGDSFLAHLSLARLDTAGVRRLDVGSRPFLVVSAPGALWVACWRNPEGGKDGKVWSEVLRVDPLSLEIQARVRIEGVISDLAATAEGIWVAGYRTGLLQRLDPASLATTATVRKGDNPERMLVTSEALWVSDRSHGTLESVDLRTLELNRKRIRGLKRPFSIVEAHGLLWILDTESQTAVSLDPKSRELVGPPIPLPGRPGAMVYGDGSLWIWSGGTRALQRIDPSKRAVVATIPLGIPTSDLTYKGRALWLASSADGRLIKIDPATNRIASKSACVGLEIASIAASEDAVYVADNTIGTIARVPLH